MPTTWPWNEFVARNESRPGISTVERRRLVVHREAADLEERERGRLLRVPERLGGGDLHRLDVGDGDAELAAEDELDAERGRTTMIASFAALRKSSTFLPPQQVPAGDAEHEEPAGHQPRQEHVPPGKPHELLEEDVEDVVRLRPGRSAS